MNSKDDAFIPREYLEDSFQEEKGMLLVVDTSTCMAVGSRSTSSDDKTFDEILAGKRRSLNGG
jgi:hypothetical protein